MKNKHTGFTLIEILVALALGGLLLSAVVQIVGNNSQNITIAQAYSETQESGRLATEMLSRDFRMLGYQGCIETVDDSRKYDTVEPGPNNTDGDFFNNGRNITFIDDFDPSATYPADQMPSAGNYGGVVPLTGSDVIISRGVTQTNIKIEKIPSGNAASAQVTGPSAEVEIVDNLVTANGGDLPVMLTDCDNATSFVASQFNPGNDSDGKTDVNLIHNTGNWSPGNQSCGNANSGNPPDWCNNSPQLGASYGPDARLLLPNTSVYFVGASQAITGANSLYKFSQLGGLVELVPYFKDFSLSYGLDTDFDNILDSEGYIDGASVDETSYPFYQQLVSVRFTFSIDSPTTLSGSPLTRTYSKVVQIRNAKIGLD